MQKFIFAVCHCENNAFKFKAGCDRTISNFGPDIKDSVVYGNLINQIQPPGSGVNKLPLQKSDLKERAEGTLEQADKIDCRYGDCHKRTHNVTYCI